MTIKIQICAIPKPHALFALAGVATGIGCHARALVRPKFDSAIYIFGLCRRMHGNAPEIRQARLGLVSCQMMGTDLYPFQEKTSKQMANKIPHVPRVLTHWHIF